MAAGTVCFYLVEGQMEEKAVKILKGKYILSGKVSVLHQRKISNTLLRLIPRESKVIIVFDTDAADTEHTLYENLNMLSGKTSRRF